MQLKYKDKIIELEDCLSFMKRLKGFMFCKNIDRALLFRHCNSIHTFFMKEKIDVIMCDKDYKVIKYYAELGKRRIILPKMGVYSVIETPSNYFDIKIGDYVEEVMQEFKQYYNFQIVVIASKGIVNGGRFIEEIVSLELETDNIVVISGPTFATDLEKEIPAAVTVGCRRKELGLKVKDLLETEYFKLEIKEDILGIEFCGAIKNVIAISTGIIEGMGYPETTRYKYLTRIIGELSNILLVIGGKKETIFSLAGIGDLLLTTTSCKSRNYSLGVVRGREDNYQEYLNNNTVEGYFTLGEVQELLRKKNIHWEIINILEDIFYKGDSLEKFKEYLKK